MVFIHPLSHSKNISPRERADRQMRDHFIDIFGEDLATLNLYESMPWVLVFRFTSTRRKRTPYFRIQLYVMPYFGRGRQRDV